jgi:hypothetical protein
MCCMWTGEHETARCACFKRSGSDLLENNAIGFVSEDYPIVFNNYSEDNPIVPTQQRSEGHLCEHDRRRTNR